MLIHNEEEGEELEEVRDCEAVVSALFASDYVLYSQHASRKPIFTFRP